MSGIKELRIAQELSQRELGKRAGVPQWRISLLERGVKPTKDEFEQLVKVLMNGQREQVANA